MKNTTLLFIVVFLIIGTGVILFQNGLEEPTGNVTSNGDDLVKENLQSVTLSLKNGNYYPQEVRVKSGQPVEITLDRSVSGCYRSFVIRGLGVSIYSKGPSEKIVFTPEKPGAYRFSCSMGMGYGSLIVK